MSGKTILIVDDDSISYLLLYEILSQFKANIVGVTNGYDAISFVKKNKVDIILMDIVMPGMNGLDATIQIKTFASHIPIIVQTANGMPQHKTECLKAGCDAYFAKPLDIKAFTEAVRAYLQ